MGRLSSGVLAGAVGTLALNAATYLDMAVRNRPASRTPEQSVRAMSRRLHLDLGRRRDNRTEALGTLLGYAVGAAVGAGYAVLASGPLARLLTTPPVGTAVLSGGALLAGNAPMTALGVTDPRRWRAEDWFADVLPHLAYGVAATYAYRRLQRR